MDEHKWNLFLKRAWPFRVVPFADFVLAAGSLATGDMHEDSDFDVIVGARQGRIFTARFFSAALFRFLGWARRHGDTKGSAKDKICLSHFVTPNAYRLSPPYNKYWKFLYQSLVPVHGEPKTIQAFWDANQDWMGERKIYSGDERHIYTRKNTFQKFLEILLGGRAGDWIEYQLKAAQLRKIHSRQEESTHKPRVIVNDNELEFHPDTRRIEQYIKNDARG